MLAPSLPCMLSLLPHETNRGFNCWWASLCVVLIIPSREPRHCSALKVQKLQRPVLTEPLWNNKLNEAYNKREGKLSSHERGLPLKPDNPIPLSLMGSLPLAAPSHTQFFLWAWIFLSCGHSCCIKLLGLFRQELGWKSGEFSGFPVFRL